MIALLVALAVTVLLLVAVVVCRFRPALAAAVVAATVRTWRRSTGVDYGRHSTAATPPSGLRMRDQAGGVDWTTGVPRVVPKGR